MRKLRNNNYDFKKVQEETLKRAQMLERQRANEQRRLYISKVNSVRG